MSKTLRADRYSMYTSGEPRQSKFGYDTSGAWNDDGLDFGTQRRRPQVRSNNSPHAGRNANSSTRASGRRMSRDMRLGAPAGATGFLPTKAEGVCRLSNGLYSSRRHVAVLTFQAHHQCGAALGAQTTGLKEASNLLITGFDCRGGQPDTARPSGFTTRGVFRFCRIGRAEGRPLAIPQF
jgi:hypothetical protein